MRNTVVKSLLTVSLLAAIALPALAQDGPSRPAGQVCTNEHPCGPTRGSTENRHQHGQKMGLRMGNPGLAMADRLAGVEIYIGVTPAQDAAWRDYTTALLAFAEAGGRPQGQRPQDQPPMLMAERMADQAIMRGEKADALKSAATALKAALTPEQLARLIAAEAPPQGEGRGPGQWPDRPMPPQAAD